MKTKLPSGLSFAIVAASNIICDSEFLSELEKNIDEEKVGIIVERLYEFVSENLKGESTADVIYALYTLLYLLLSLVVEEEE
jgi:hypothetical protein